MSDASNTDPIDVGVYGVGNMGAHHARAYAELRDARLVGVHDADDERAQEVAAAHGTEALGGNELLNRADAISIAVPTAHHYDIARRAINREVAVLIEKPLVASPSEGMDLVQRATHNGVTLQVGHVERFNPAVEALKDVLPDLEILAVDARRLGPPVDRDGETSVVLDLMIHDLDVALSIVDADVAFVEAAAARDDRYVSATVSFENGVVGSFRASRVTQRKVRRLQITAVECTVEVDYIDQSIQIHRHSLPEYVETDGDLRYRHESVIERPTVGNGEPLKNELHAFLRAVRTDDPPPVTGEDGLRALSLANDVVRAAGIRPEPDRGPTLGGGRP